MAKTKKIKSVKSKEESTIEAVVEEILTKVVEPTPEKVSEAKEEVKEAQEEVSSIIVPVIEVEDLTSYEPDTIDEFAVFSKAKEEKGDKVWVKDHELLRKVEGRQFTLGGTLYFGDLKS